MATLQKLDILSLGRLKTEAVAVDGADEIIISEMGAVDSQDLYTNPAYQTPTGGVFMEAFAPALLARSIVDSNGNRLFNDDDAKIIARWPRLLFDKLSLVAMRLNAMDCATNETVIKNSAPSPE